MSVVRQTVVICNVCGKQEAEPVEITIGELTRSVDLCPVHIKPVQEIFDTGEITTTEELTWGTLQTMYKKQDQD